MNKTTSKCAVLHSSFKIFMYPSLCIFHLHFTNFVHITIHKMYACIKLKATPFCTFFCIGRQQFYNWLSGKRKWRMYPEMFWFSGGSLSKTQWKPYTKIFHLIIFATKVLFLKLKFFSFWHHNYQRDIAGSFVLMILLSYTMYNQSSQVLSSHLKNTFILKKKMFLFFCIIFIFKLSPTKVPTSDCALNHYYSNKCIISLYLNAIVMRF